MNNEHTCAGIQHLGHRQATATFLGAQIQAKLHDQPNYRPKDIQDDIHRQFGLHVNYMIAYHTKEHGLAEINRMEEESYDKMPEYCEDLKWNNRDGTSTMGFQF